MAKQECLVSSGTRLTAGSIRRVAIRTSDDIIVLGKLELSLINHHNAQCPHPINLQTRPKHGSKKGVQRTNPSREGKQALGLHTCTLKLRGL